MVRTFASDRQNCRCGVLHFSLHRCAASDYFRMKMTNMTAQIRDEHIEPRFCTAPQGLAYRFPCTIHVSSWGTGLHTLIRHAADPLLTLGS